MSAPDKSTSPRTSMSVFIAYTRAAPGDPACEEQRREIESARSVSRWYSDEASAIPTMQLPGLSALLADARNGDTVVVAGVGRLGKDATEVLRVVETLQGKGVAVVSTRERVDLSTPAGELALTMMAAMERLDVKAREFPDQD